MKRGLSVGVAVLAIATVVPLRGTRATFVPDWTFKGSALTGWTVLGQAEWRAADGELIGKPKAPEGGWLVLDKSFQDVQFGADFRCTGDGCKTGVLLRAEKTPTGMKGLYVSLDPGETGSFAVTLDASGKELSRDKLSSAGGMARFAPTAPPTPPAGAPPAAAGAGRGGAGRGGGAAGAGRGGPSAVTSIVARPPNALKPNEWNDLDIVIDATLFRPHVNSGAQGAGGSVAVDEAMGKFGPIALYVGGAGEVRFRDVSIKDVNLKRFAKEETSPNFRMQRLSPFLYSWSQAAADVNKDGNLDIIIPPFIYLGPDFTTAREFYAAETLNPSTVYPSIMVGFAADFTGDGWPDYLSTNGGRLYVNPKGEARRWDVHPNVVTGVSEICVMKDIDGDGAADLVHVGTGGTLRYSKPDPGNPTGPWISTTISEPGSTGGHGIGAGDINGDGRPDIVNAYGWWEQPPRGQTGLWTYHPQAFGRWTGRASEGGAEMAVFDANRDGLADVVTVLQAHGFGIAWFEQKRDSAGGITFVQHMIADDFAAKNAGGVTFSEPHGATAGDVDGDGVPDFIVGKRYWSHHEGFLDPDPYGPPVLYAYLTRRNAKAPGGAEFVPELINNQSGAGSQILATDINKDGVVDVVTAGTHGAYVFFGKARGGRAKSSPAGSGR
jgi:3-keto-disaccharide hydrolase/FG-GAP-like repeat